MTAEVLTPTVAPERRITFAMRAAHFARGNVLFVFGGCLFAADRAGRDLRASYRAL